MAKKATKKLYAAERSLIKDNRSHDFSSAQDSRADEIIAAIESLKDEIRKGMPAPSDARANPVPGTDTSATELAVLRGQLFELRDSIEKTKSEIAAVRMPGQEDDRLTGAAMELDAIVRSTENATNDILNATEDIGDKVEKLKERSGDHVSNELLDEINGLAVNIMEACNFQDLAGQRTTKVVKTINFLEDRITTMINIWGAEEFKDVKVQQEALDEDKALMEGPQFEGKGVDQSDVDALFD